MYTALYRKYRPATFDEMVGQEHIVKILKNQIKTGNTAHAYLFCGTRGTGKTSAARIFAKGVNCLAKGDRPCGKCENCESIQKGVFFDVIEIDAASNNRVDNIRELRESVKYPPAAGLCKVYIIDEVHMLSSGAFNALLKTLEEPPQNVIFILATTEPHKLPATILSRCLRLDFRRVSEAQIKEKLKQICNEQGIEFEESALSLIAANGDGSVRDSLSILEQCIPAGEKTLLRKDVIDILGTAGEEIFIEITDSVINNDTAGAFLIVEKIAKDGKDIRQFIKDWILHFRNLMMSKFALRLEDIMNMSCENVDRVKKQGERIDMAFISSAITELSSTSNKARYSTQPRTLLEVSILKLSNPALSDEKEAIIQRIERIEAKLLENPQNPGNLKTDNKDFDEKPSQATSKPSVKPPLQQSEEKPLKKEEAVDKKAFAKAAEKGVEAEAETEKSSKQESPEAEPANEKDRLWKQAFRKALEERASLRILGDAAAVSLQNGSIVIAVSSALKKSMLEQNAELLEKCLKAAAGQEIRMQVTISTEAKSEENTGKAISGLDPKTRRRLEELIGSDKLTISE